MIYHETGLNRWFIKILENKKYIIWYFIILIIIILIISLCIGLTCDTSNIYITKNTKLRSEYEICIDLCIKNKPLNYPQSILSACYDECKGKSMKRFEISV